MSVSDHASRARANDEGRSTTALITIAAIWLLGIAVLSELGVFERIARLSAPAYGGVIALFSATSIAFYLTRRRFARTLDAIPIRALTLFHAPRIFGGLAFLAFGAAGVLSPVMAACVGYGDIISGAAALSLLAVRTPGPRLFASIHVIGLADLTIGLLTGMTLGLQGDPRLVPLAAAPLSLIVLFWAPLLATSHVAALRRLARR